MPDIAIIIRSNTPRPWQLIKGYATHSPSYLILSGPVTAVLQLAEGTHPSLSLPPTQAQPGIDITGKFGNDAADCHIPKRLEDQRIQEHDKSRKSMFFDALHR